MELLYKNDISSAFSLYLLWCECVSDSVECPQSSSYEFYSIVFILVSNLTDIPNYPDTISNYFLPLITLDS